MMKLQMKFLLPAGVCEGYLTALISELGTEAQYLVYYVEKSFFQYNLCARKREQKLLWQLINILILNYRDDYCWSNVPQCLSIIEK